MNISYSRVSSYMRCPYAHYLGYEIGVKSAKPARPLYFGTDFHKLLELRHNKAELKKAKQEIEDSYYSIPSKWQSDLGENYLSDLFSIFEDYCDIYKEEKPPSITELEFNIPIFTYKGEPYIFKGKIDELYKRKAAGEKYIKIGEHKTFNRRPNNDTLVLNAQKNLYAKAAQMLYGILPRSVIWDYIHSTPANQPIWLEKTKRFSTGKSQYITPYSWIRACKEHGITDKATLKAAENFRGNVPNFFFRVEQTYEPEAIEAVWEGFLYQAKMIAEHGKENKTKNLGQNCAWCEYRDICYSQLNGGNLDYLMERNYIVESREDIVTEGRRAKDEFFDNYTIPF